MLKEIAKQIENNQSFLITAHESPDGDAIGSCLALASYLYEIGKDVTVHLKDPVPDLYRFLPLSDTVFQQLPDRDFDICFVLDVGEFRRAGKQVVDCKRIGAFINVDHHKTSENFGIINLIDVNAAATGLLVYRIIKAAGGEISLRAAQSIYVALLADTGSFRYSNSNPEAFSVAGEMIAKGVNAWDISSRLYESQPRERIELLSLALSTLAFSDCGRVATIAVTLDMYGKTGTDAELTDGFVNYPRSVKGVEVAIFFRQLTATSYKAGFRSKGLVDVSALAAPFGGGGHHNAAGCNIDGTLEEVREKVFSHIKAVLQ